MERLTDRFDGQAILICENETCKIYGDGMCSAASPCNTEQDMIDRLAAYEDAEEQGLLVRLPCKVGDMIYRPIRVNNGIYAYAVSSIEIPPSGEVIVYDGLCGYSWSDFGKTVFLTREEAEAALKEG